MRYLAILALGLTTLGHMSAYPADGSESRSLRVQLLDLAAEHRITLRGVDRLGDEPATDVALDASPAKRIRQLLLRYNYMMRETSEGQVTALHILGPSPEPTATPRNAAIPTMRKGTLHLVETIIVGPSGARRMLPLVIDTGASSVVLPQSLSKELGFNETDLKSGWVNTAGGRQEAQIGLLKTVTLGGKDRHNVPVAFLDDEQIGDTALLGMSFLKHFNITLPQSGNMVYLSDR